jgi:hypothetical protein
MVVIGEIVIDAMMVVAIATAASMAVWLVVASITERGALRNSWRAPRVPERLVLAATAGHQTQSATRPAHTLVSAQTPVSHTRA